MNKVFFWFVIILLIVGGAWYLFGSSQISSVQQPQVQLNADVYPLYSGVSWGSALATTSPDFGPVTEVQAIAATGTTNIAAASTPFTKYYNSKLIAAGWTHDLNREASGPGSNISVYTKGDQFIVVQFSSVFHNRQPNAPVQCPCDVELTLMSGTQQGPTPAQQLQARTYHDSSLGFSIVLPTALASSTSDTLWSVDPNYTYTEKGPGKSIAGVKFTIPGSMAAGTNLASDSYLSVEHLPAGAVCNASAFLADPNAKSQTQQYGSVAYSVASSSGAAAGNRYDEWVYALPGSDPCIAVRYYIHYGAIQNYPSDGSVKQFDELALRQAFDDIRLTLHLAK